MTEKYRFKKFSFGSFIGFIKNLISEYDMGEIRFTPIKKGDFSVDNKRVLEHMGEENVQETFVNVWSKNLDKMKVVSFELFKKNGGLPKIKMTFDLNNNFILLNEAQEITAGEIEESLGKFFDLERVGGVNIWWKYTHPVWWVWMLLVLIFKDGLWRLLELAWKHKLISGIILVILIPLFVQLLANYLSYKWGWSR